MFPLPLFQISRFMSVNKLKYFFAVDTRYVLKKLMILMFPYTHQVIRERHKTHAATYAINVLLYRILNHTSYSNLANKITRHLIAAPAGVTTLRLPVCMYVHIEFW